MKAKAVVRAPNLRRAYFESRFGQLHCRTAFPSTGGFDELTPLVALHDGPGSSVSLAPLLPRLGQDRSIYVPDLPGCGQSDAPPGIISLADHAAAISEMLRSLRLRSVDVLGVGVGAAVAVEMAHYLGTAVRRLVLINPPTETVSYVPWGLPDASGSGLASLWAARAPLDSDADALRAYLPVFGELIAGGQTGQWPAVALSRWSWRDRTAGLTAPVLALSANTAVARALPSSWVVESIPAHLDLALGDASLTIKSIRQFLDR